MAARRLPCPSLLCEMERQGAYLLKPDERDRVRDTVFPGGRFDTSPSARTPRTLRPRPVSASRAVPGSCSLLSGDVVDALAALDDRDLDLLVCGSRGYGPLRRVLLGGASSKLVRRAATPVMVVPRSAG